MGMVKRLLKEYNIVIILVVLAVAAFLSVPVFSNKTNLLNLLTDLSMYGILAVGVTFVLISGEVDLSIGMSVALSTITCALFASKLGGAAGLIAPIVTSAAVSLILGILTTKFRMNSLIASIAIMTSVQGLCYIIGGGRTVALTNEFVRSLYTFKLFGARLLSLPTVVFIIVIVAGGIVLYRTRLGREIYVTGGNAEAGYMTGINISRTKLICFLICGFLGGIMAILMTSFVYCGAVNYGEGLNLTMISACVLGGVKFTGGKGSVIHTLLGICAMRIIINVSSLLSLSAWAQSTITGVLLILVLILDRYNRVQREEDAV